MGTFNFEEEKQASQNIYQKILSTAWLYLEELAITGYLTLGN
jgi:hypothetical protein